MNKKTSHDDDKEEASIYNSSCISLSVYQPVFGVALRPPMLQF